MKLSLTGILLVGIVFAICNRGLSSNDQRPNVVFFLADDLGWSDTTLFGTTDYYQTPNVKRLADQGITFTRAYSASPLCSPTRASILTGMNPARIGLTSPTCHLPRVVLTAKQGTRGNSNVPAYPNTSVTRLDTRFRTLGEAFQEAGYATGHFGKWHLGHEPYSPLEHGFDVDVPHWPGPGPAGSYVAPWKFPDFDPDTPNEHIEDRMANEATRFIEQNRDKPFFLNYWMFSVHAPFDAKSDLIKKYQQKLDPKGHQRSPTYAAMVESMDDAVGSLLDALEKNKLTRKTIVIFFSDNGGNMYNLVDGVAATSNYPLRGGKATMFEGGVRVPCIVSYPDKFSAGSRSSRLIQSTDFFPTLIDLIGLEPPQKTQLDGESFASELKTTGGNRASERAIFTYFPHQTRVPDWIPPSVSVHQGKWKLIRVFHGGQDGRHRYLLFDLDEDQGETKNLAVEKPDVVSKLDRMIDKFLVETKAVLPARNPEFDFQKYDLANEGKASPRPTGRQAQKNTKKSSVRKRFPKVAGWQPSAQCELALVKNNLIVRSKGNDPHLSFDLTKELPAGKYEVGVLMSSSGGGQGQLFWQEKGVDPKFNRIRSQLFPIRHDSRSKEYRIQFETPNPVLAIRIDPGQKPGLIKISSISISGETTDAINLLKLEKKKGRDKD